MAIEIAEFHKELQQEVYGRADADERFLEDAFFEVFTDHLINAGELETADRAYYQAPRGMRIDGYGGDPAETSNVLNLIVSDFSQSSEITTLTASDMDAIFKRATNFLAKSLDSSFRDSLEETSSAFGLADLIARRWKEIDKVRFLLISNRLLSSRVDGREAGEERGVPLTFGVWDMSRLYRFVTAGFGREEITIDLEKEFGGPLHALRAHLKEAGYEAYLIVVPGIQIAEIYDRWGARLLEHNVRVFLQARGNVNKGMRNTLENDAGMFFAYNNGITATAESVTTSETKEGFFITGLQNLQIVNGGQTTASIHAASRKKGVDLTGVFVQMKLSIIEPSKVEEVVPKISEYANTQNRVNAADFFANHPFHLRMEEFSRRIYAPSPEGTFRESKWFYERARGQYQDARSKLTTAQTKKFELEYPKQQVFTKTDLAKYINSWDGFPQIVSKGAQKNFAHFAGVVGRQWQKQSNEYNETYYKHAIAKAIIFKETEAIVTAQPWYEGGYRANIVTYSLAKLAQCVARTESAFDFDTVWRKQRMPPQLVDAITLVARTVHDVIVTPPPRCRNVTEWAKMDGCWESCQELPIQWPVGLLDSLTTTESQRQVRQASIKEQKMLNGIEAQMAVVKAGGEFWEAVRKWGLERQLLSPKEIGILAVAESIPSRTPSDKQSLVLIDVLKKLQGEGCQLGLDIVKKWL